MDLPLDLLPLLPSGLPLLPSNLPLLSSVGAGRRRVGCGGEREGESERRPIRLVAEAVAAASWIGELGVSWIGWVGELGVSEGKREKGD